MDQETRKRFEDMLAEAGQELFAAYRVALAQAEPGGAVGTEAYAATIGYTHELVCGALTITLGPGLLGLSLPAQLKAGAADEETLADWCGELANQLLGRIKVKLVAHGVEIALSTPVIFKGRQLSHFPQAGAVSVLRGFGHAAGHLDLEFQALAKPGFALGEPGNPDRTGAVEGEVALF